MNIKLVLIGTIILAAMFALACGGSAGGGAGKTIVSGPAGDEMTATLANADGVLRKGGQSFTLTFTDKGGKPVDVGAVALNYRMPAMGSMAEMNNGAIFKSSGTPGVYNGKVDLEMSGEWQAMITYEGPAGTGAFKLPVVVK